MILRYATSTSIDESDLTDHENTLQVLEREKHRNLNKKQHKTSTPHEGFPGWNEYLASDSEAFVKAQRSADAGHTDPKTLVEDTIQRVKKKHHGGAEGEPTVTIKAETEQFLTSDNGEVSEAKYERDEVTGPLKEAVSKVAEVLTGSNGKKN